MSPDWLEVHEGDRPLIVSFPHTGTLIPAEIEARLVSPWLARKDADWWIHELYAFARELGATTVRTAMSRSVIDVNRDPSGASLYPGMATTELCPATTFDGEPLYADGGPAADDVADRTARWFAPYHAELERQIARLHDRHGVVVIYDAHSIRSRIPRLFEGALPHFNIGTNGGATCAPNLSAAVERACAVPPFERVLNGRFKGGWTTRRYGRPEAGVHAIQMELACRAYLDEPPGDVDPGNWPVAFDPARAAACQAVLRDVLTACLARIHA